MAFTALLKMCAPGAPMGLQTSLIPLAIRVNKDRGIGIELIFQINMYESSKMTRIDTKHFTKITLLDLETAYT